ncbi:ABC transporter, ATPase subunit [Plesiocystis pacifica SIR-1]|uniref:ABC transporter, ATPase subunit n=1 Tax=Plesiocystis pacifica SIR-1 TaxID=391625 RepID=A6G4W8_9BACT|nr:ABC transporter ATP-binding protein [Plesiocystis pacifica]EDM79060.1 ABC transporter, ATPase subunit [Plesiocystis pacifica SIR-1]
MSAPPLRARGLSKRYLTRAVLDGLDLEVAGGEAVALLGPNGAGKSTLLGCVCGTVIPDAGSVEIGGHVLDAAPIAARAALRYLPQETEHPAGLTGRELLRFHAEVFGDLSPASLERAEALAKLGPALDHLATTYSVGMRRRLAAACLVPGRAALYVFDEPFAGLDTQAREGLLAWMRALLAEGAGLLLAAHEQDRWALDALDVRPFPLTPPTPPAPEAQP